MNPRLKQLRLMAIVTVVAVLFLIWVGSTVRATDAGMGCPDWPTCFGQVIPPMSEADLPADYRQQYARYGYDEMRFDPVRTWTEYLNRLTGTMIGFLSLMTLLLAVMVRRTDRWLPALAGGAFVLVGFNGWLGAVVVETNLHAAVVTTHMMLSFGVILLLLGVVIRTLPSSWRIDPSERRQWFPVLPVALLLTLIQTGLGAQVREQVDQVAATAADFHVRTGWVEQIGAILSVHMVVATLVVLANLWLAWRLSRGGQLARRMAMLLVALLAVQVTLGGALVGFDLPIAVQPLHLLGAATLFGLQAFLLMLRPALVARSTSTGRYREEGAMSGKSVPR
ncbi:COX15/CtaA family protein [Guyparkeria hydrothermalis]|uniref:COX15/CtaA family protein n=1 Tax=Guyparkeria hydrothermalis TaxID=923 RepID=UPI0020207D1B|nr:COX15/CtaA family protein [Guyparkeria hydrothermalis]MCL7743563.1 COX15/CtaA family protein [Guyparkeria hydrothermalis]